MVAMGTIDGDDGISQSASAQPHANDGTRLVLSIEWHLLGREKDDELFTTGRAKRT
jgi:hypothetical protein